MTKTKEINKKQACKDCLHSNVKNKKCELFNIVFSDEVFNKKEYCRNFEFDKIENAFNVIKEITRWIIFGV